MVRLHSLSFNTGWSSKPPSAAAPALTAQGSWWKKMRRGEKSYTGEKKRRAGTIYPWMYTESTGWSNLNPNLPNTGQSTAGICSSSQFPTQTSLLWQDKCGTYQESVSRALCSRPGVAARPAQDPPSSLPPWLQAATKVLCWAWNQPPRGALGWPSPPRAPAGRFK